MATSSGMAKSKGRGPAVALVPCMIASLLLLAGAADVRAQAPSDRDIEIEQKTDRFTPVAPEKPDVLPRKDYEISLGAPFLYTTNAARSREDFNVRRGDWHFNPDLLVRWSHQYSFLKLSAYVDLSVDRFMTQTRSDEDTVYGYAKAALTDGTSDLFVPYISYNAIIDFRPDFESWDDSLHDLAIGISSGLGVASSGRIIRYKDAFDPGDSAIGVDFKVGRRLSDPRDFENTFVVLAFDFWHVFDDQWTIGLTPKLRVKWYDNFFGDFRRDVRPSAVLKVVWTPDWLVHLIRRAEIDFTASFLRSFSNISDGRVSEWEFGPTVTLAWRF